jgi:chromosome segregation ATPase
MRAEVLDMILEDSATFLTNESFIRCIVKHEQLQDLAMGVLARIALHYEEQLQEQDEQLQSRQKEVAHHKSRKDQLRTDVAQLEEQCAKALSTTNTRLEEETAKIRDQFEERITRFKQQAKDQDKKRREEIADVHRELVQSKADLQAAELALGPLKSAHAEFQIRTVDLEHQIRVLKEQMENSDAGSLYRVQDQALGTQRDRLAK